MRPNLKVHNISPGFVFYMEDAELGPHITENSSEDETAISFNLYSPAYTDVEGATAVVPVVYLTSQYFFLFSLPEKGSSLLLLPSLLSSFSSFSHFPLCIFKPLSGLR
jgi:hypothetical protein